MSNSQLQTFWVSNRPPVIVERKRAASKYVCSQK